MKPRIREQAPGTETKKDYIIRLAKEDPFLKIEEIAVAAVTTTRYVRTILSEANLSLMNLREEYARKMEQNTGAKIAITVKGAAGQKLQLTERSAGFQFSRPERFYQKEHRSFDWHDKKSPLFQYIQRIKLAGEGIPLGYLILFTGIEGDEEMFKEKLIFEQLGLDFAEMNLTSPNIEAADLTSLLPSECWAGVRQLIGSEAGGESEAYCKIHTHVHRQSEVIAEAIYLFRSEAITLTIPGMFSPLMEVI